VPILFANSLFCARPPAAIFHADNHKVNFFTQLCPSIMDHARASAPHNLINEIYAAPVPCVNVHPGTWTVAFIEKTCKILNQELPPHTSRGALPTSTKDSQHGMQVRNTVHAVANDFRGGPLLGHLFALCTSSLARTIRCRDLFARLVFVNWFPIPLARRTWLHFALYAYFHYS